MSFEITTAFVKQFGSAVDFLAQDRGNKLMPAMGMVERIVGEEAFMDQIGATAAIRTNTRHADSPLISTPHARRRVGIQNIEWGDLVDNFDKVRTLIDPTNSYTMNAGWAVGREMDDIIIETFHADALTGKTGSVVTPYDTANDVAITVGGGGSPTGLNIEKLRRARRILRQNEVDIDRDGPYFIAVTAAQLDDLLGTVEITSADFNTVKALVRGEIDTFMGFTFIDIQRLNLTAGTTDEREIPFWAKSGMGVAIGMSPTARIAERADKRFSTYAYWSTVFGATRLQEAKVGRIFCLETT